MIDTKSTGLTELYQIWEDRGISPFFPEVLANNGNHITTDRHDDLLMFGSCDYLGLSQHPALAEAAVAAVQEYGTNTYGAQLLCGHTRIHHQIERRLAALGPQEAALLFPSGMAANQAVLSTMAAAGDVIIADRTAHISIFMGGWLSGADLRTFPHNNVTKLAGILRRTSDARRRVVVVDGLYSADGDYAPLVEITELAAEHGAMVVVDEAHSFGAVGPLGLGVADELGVLAEVDVVVGTMSKAMGSVGGFVLTSAEFKRKLRYLAPSYTSSRSSAPAVAGATLAALDILDEHGPALRARLRANTTRVLEGLRSAGLDVGQTRSHIVPVLIGDESTTVEVANWLMMRGVFTAAFVYPHVPAGAGRLRVGVTSGHTEAECDRLVELLVEASRTFGFNR